jgi:hypothetical protein
MVAAEVFTIHTPIITTAAETERINTRTSFPCRSWASARQRLGRARGSSGDFRIVGPLSLLVLSVRCTITVRPPRPRRGGTETQEMVFEDEIESASADIGVHKGRPYPGDVPCRQFPPYLVSVTNSAPRPPVHFRASEIIEARELD